MKASLIAASVASVSATWGTWSATSYCDYSQILIDSTYSYDASYDEDQCQDWCHETMEANELYYGSSDSFCCDLEDWTDGSADCYLWAGDDTISYTWSGTGYSYFTCMTFDYGDNYSSGTTYTSNWDDLEIDCLKDIWVASEDISDFWELFFLYPWTIMVWFSWEDITNTLFTA